MSGQNALAWPKEPLFLRSGWDPPIYIDYLRAHTSVEEVWYRLDGQRLEHVWAERISLAEGASVPPVGLGSTDLHRLPESAYQRRRSLVPSRRSALGACLGRTH